MEVKRLAVAVAAYLKDRMAEEQEKERSGGQWDRVGYHRWEMLFERVIYAKISNKTKVITSMVNL